MITPFPMKCFIIIEIQKALIITVKGRIENTKNWGMPV